MKKKKKTKRPSSSSNPINGSDPSSFHVSIAATAVAQICRSLGFKSTQTTALQTLTNVTVRYLSSIATSAATSAASTGRTECNLYDVIRGLEEVHDDVGFKGNSAVTRRLSSLSESEMLKDLMRFVEWNLEMPFAKPLVTSSSSSSSSYPMEKKVLPRGSEMMTSLNGEKRAVNEGESEVVPRGKQVVTSLNGEKRAVNEVKSGVLTRGQRKMMTSLCENEKLNAEKNDCGEKETVNEGGEKERKKGVPRGKQIVTSLCENEKLNGEKEAVNKEGENERKKGVPRGKQMLTSLYGEYNGNEKFTRRNYCGEKRGVNEGKIEVEVMPRGTSEKSETCHVPEWLPDFPNRGEKDVFTEEGKKSESESENEKEKEKVNYNYHKEVKVSELPEVRKKVRFEIKGLKKSKRVKDVIKVKLGGLNLKSGLGVYKGGGKRILCQIYQHLEGEKYGNNGMVKVKYARRR